MINDATDISFQSPVVQIALDVTEIDEALRLAELSVKAGADWLEAGTPLIVAQGYSAIGKLADAFPGIPVLADYKTMDGGGRNVHITREQGGRLMTVCGNAADETIQAATRASAETGVWVVIDTIGVKDQVARVQQCVEWGAQAIYLHYGFDQHQADDSKDANQWVAQVKDAVDVPIGIGCFGCESAELGVKLGADIFCVGHPLISASDPLDQLQRFVGTVKQH